MGIFDFIGNIFKPAVELIDEIHVSDEERLALRNEFANIQAKAQEKIIELEETKVKALSNVQIAESKSKFFLVAAWRPMVSIVLVTLIVLGSFGIVTLGPEIYELTKIMLGAYVSGRSLEKIASVVKLGK